MYYSYLEPKWGPLFWLEKSGLVLGCFFPSKNRGVCIPSPTVSFSSIFGTKNPLQFFRVEDGKTFLEGQLTGKAFPVSKRFFALVRPTFFSILGGASKEKLMYIYTHISKTTISQLYWKTKSNSYELGSMFLYP